MNAGQGSQLKPYKPQIRSGGLTSWLCKVYVGTAGEVRKGHVKLTKGAYVVVPFEQVDALWLARL